MPEPTQTPTAGLTRPVPAPMDKAPSSWATTSTLRRRETTSLLSGPMPAMASLGPKNPMQSPARTVIAISSPPTSRGDLRIYLGSHNSHLTRPRDPSRGLALAVQHRKRDRRADHLGGEQFGLVEPPLTQTGRVKGNRNNQVNPHPGIGGHYLCDQPAEGLSQRLAATEL